MNPRDLIQSAAVLVIFASAYALIKIALTELPPITIGAIRFVLASALMVPLALVYHPGKNPHENKIASSDLPLLFVLSLFQIFLPNLLQNIGLEYTTASVSSVLQSTTPVFTLLLSLAILKERIGSKEVTGVTLGMIGVVLLSTGGDITRLAGSVLLGNALQVGVAASYAVSGMIGKHAIKKYVPTVVVTASFLFGALLLSLFAFALERRLWPRFVSNGVMLALLLLSLLYCLALVSWYDVLQRTTVFQLYVLLFAMPVLSVLISVIVLREAFTVLDVVFSALTILGVGIALVGRRD